MTKWKGQQGGWLSGHLNQSEAVAEKLYVIGGGIGGGVGKGGIPPTSMSWLR